MIITELLFEEERVRSLIGKLHCGCKPLCVLNKGGNEKIIAVGMKEGNIDIGIIHGSTVNGNGLFSINCLYVINEYRTHNNVLLLLKTILSAVESILEVNEVIWTSNSDRENNSRLKLLSGISFCRVKRIDEAKRYWIGAKDFNKIRGYSKYSEKIKNNFWDENGYQVIKWSECENTIKNSIRKKETSGVDCLAYLSPFTENTDEYWICDNQTSFILIKTKPKEVVGWIICQKLSKDEVMIRRLYIYPHERPALVGHMLATHVLLIASNIYSMLGFHVIKGNRQMEMTVRQILADAISSSNSLCSIRIDLRVGNPV